jgi:hypothetical protein
MDLLDDNRPETCATLGLKCGSCIRDAAANVAGICRGLETGGGVQQIFIQLFPSPGCRPMARAFELAYLEASATPKPLFSFRTAAA